jgi:hypothetical protein
MDGASAFSENYVTARERFITAANRLGYRLEQHSIGQRGPEEENLTIDVACAGDTSPKRVVVVSSGIHGVEAFFGSAVQIAILENFLQHWNPAPSTAIVLMHALNPYGFAWLRRVNEDNVDLNRNFLPEGEEYSGSPPQYAELNPWLNPRGTPPVVSLYYLEALWHIFRNGLSAMKEVVAGGQYDFPEGLFFGGNGPSVTMQIMKARLPQWIGPAEDVLHVDLHTGLGPWGTYKLLVDKPSGSEYWKHFARQFPEKNIENFESGTGLAYPIHGCFPPWCSRQFPNCHYDLVGCEVGTYNPVRVLAALRAENRAHHYSDPASPWVQQAKQRLKETFGPGDPGWRNTVVSHGVRVVEKAIEILLNSKNGN